MAAKTFYMTNTIVTSFQEMSETSPGSDVLSSPAVGWIVGTGTTGTAPLAAGGEEVAAAFVASPVHPDTTLDLTEAMRTPSPLSGSFASGNWVFHGVVRATTNGGAQDGRLAVRLWRSANANGSGATEITSSRLTTSNYTNLATSADQDCSVTFNPGAFSLSNEYLFLAIGCERTGAGGMTSADVNFRIGTNSTRLISADFASTVGLSGSASAAATVAGDAAVTRGLAGAVAGASTVAGDLTVSTGVAALSGQVSGAATASGSLEITRGLQGQVAATATVAGAAEITRGLSGSVDGLAAAAGSMAVKRGLSGTVSAVATVAGNLSVPGSSVALSGAVAGVATVAGDVDVRRGLSGAVAASGSASGAALVRRGLSGTVAASASVSGAALLRIGLSGTASATSSVSGVLVDDAVLPGAIGGQRSGIDGDSERSSMIGGGAQPSIAGEFGVSSMFGVGGNRSTMEEA